MRRCIEVITVLAAALGLGATLAACGAGGGGAAGAGRVVRLDISPADGSVAAGRSQQFSAVAVYDDGTRQDATALVAWSATPPVVARIDSTGMASSYRAGTVQIIADLGNASGAVAFTVTAPVVDRVRVEPGDRALSNGSKLQYFAYATLSNGSESDVTADATWSSTDPAVAAADNGGVVSAQANGTAEVIAAYQGAQGRTPVTVVPSVIYGGGDMIAALAYVGSSWFNAGSPAASRRLSNQRNPPEPGSLFGNLGAQSPDDPLVVYCQTGDNLGKHVFAGINVARADDACGDYADSWAPRGFSGLKPRPDFAAGELPLSGEEYIRALQNTGAYPVQIPVLAASIAISYNNPEVTWPLNLTTAQLRGIFSGAITTWDQISPNLSPNPIRVVYRGDYSAATFALSNHLSCVPRAPTATDTSQCSGGTGFNTSGWFIEVVPTVPLDWIPAGSNIAAATAVLRTPYSIGYGEAADLALRYPGLKLAEIDDVDPLVNLQSPVVSVHTSDCVINGFASAQQNSGCGPEDPTDGRAPPPPDTIAVGRPVLMNPDAQVQNNCAVLVRPDSYASPASAPDQPSAYPILSISYLMAYNGGNGPAVPAIRRLMAAAYADRLALPPGFAPLSGWAPTPELLQNCIL